MAGISILLIRGEKPKVSQMVFVEFVSVIYMFKVYVSVVVVFKAIVTRRARARGIHTRNRPSRRGPVHVVSIVIIF